MNALKRARCSVTEEICTLIGTAKTGPVPPCVFIRGPKSSGKTWLMDRFFEETGIAHVKIPSQFCRYTREFCGRVVHDVAAVVHALKRTEGATEDWSVTKPQVGDEFWALQKHLDFFPLDKRKICLVLDDAEFFIVHRKRDVMVRLMGLQETSGRNVCTILVSSSPWERFLHKQLPVFPLFVNVPQFDLESVLEILRSDAKAPKGLDGEVYEGLLRSVIKAVFPMTRDVNDIRLIVESVTRSSLGKLAALKDSSVGRDEAESRDALVFRIFSIAGPHIKEAVKRVHLREISDPCAAADFNLPIYGRYLLIAAFIASYNSPKWDKIYFAKKHAESKRKTKFAMDKKYSETKGPQSFPRTRMLDIFHSIYENAVPDDEHESLRRPAVLLPLVRSLERAGLLDRSTQDILLNVKYKCVASPRVVADVARSVKFNLGMYLKHVPKV